MTDHADNSPAISGLSDTQAMLIDRYWRAANYLSVGQIYLLDNPLLRAPLTPEHVKPRLLGHWGTTPGLNFIYAHLNRIIRARDTDLLYVCGPGHGGPGMVANTWLEGTYSEIYPAISDDEEGNYLLTSHVWRQDHNGFSHQDPGFIDLVVNKKADVVRVYLPPDANCLLRVADHCLGTHDRINVIVAGKQPSPQWLTADEAETHCAAGVGIWDWAGTDRDGREPDVVMACAGDVPTLETLAAVDLLRQHIPELKIRVVNVVDLMTLQPRSDHPHGLSDNDFDSLFTRNKPIVFAFHGYPYLIHRLTYRRANHANLHVRGFKEEGTTTTPFDMVVRNDLDRFHLAMDVIDRVPGLAGTTAHAKQAFRDRLIEHKQYLTTHGEDMPGIREWSWPYRAPSDAGD